MKPALNISLVGCGGMSAHYLNVYRDLSWVHVQSCIDVDLAQAQRAAAILSAPLATSDFSAALAESVDAVIINTPNHLHREQAVAALNADKHVLLQKPAAANLEDAQRIADAARRSTRTVGLYMSYFDQPLMHDLRRFVAEGYLGEVVHFYGRLMHKGGMISSELALSGRRTWRTSLKETGGGCFIQLAVHYIHLFEWIGGTDVIGACALTRNLHSPGVEGEDLACAVLQLRSGAIATLDTAWCSNGEQLAIHGTLGRVEYRNNRWLSVASSKSAFNGHVMHYPGGLESGFDGQHGIEQQMEVKPPSFGDVANPFNQHRVFLEAARDGQPAFCSIDSGVHDLRCVHAVYESAATGRKIEL